MSGRAAPLALFRADAGPSIGGGHVQRCVALAEILATFGWRNQFACRADTLDAVPSLKESSSGIVVLEGIEEYEPGQLAKLAGPCELLVVDHYERSHGFEAACRGFARRILVLDDQPSRQHDCDVLVDSTPRRNASEYAPLVPNTCAILTGPMFAPLRAQFRDKRAQALARREQKTTLSRILVSFGSTDPGNLTAMALQEISESQLPVAVDVVLGAAAPHLETVRRMASRGGKNIRLHVNVADMAQLASEADLAVGSFGVSSLERCSLGLPSVGIIAAENQRRYAEALVAAGAAESLGDGRDVKPGDLRKKLQSLSKGAGRRTLTRNAAALCDGRGAVRIALTLLRPQNARNGLPVTLRLAAPADRDLVLGWQQHPDTRRFAHDKRAPGAEEHAGWFARTLSDSSRFLFILQYGGVAAGVLRLDTEGPNRRKISIFVAPGHYRLGVGLAALVLARELFVQAELVAEVLPENAASRALFKKAGFDEMQPGLFVNRGRSTASA